MDEQLPTPHILPQSTEPVNYGPVRPPAGPVQAPAPPTPKVNPLIIIAGVVFILIVGSILFTSGKKPIVTVAPTPIPSETPSPTPLRILTAFATQSAFMQFEKTVDDLPGIIQSAAVQDTNLSPPVLDLKLGF